MNLGIFDKLSNKIRAIEANMPNTIKEALKEKQNEILILNKIQLDSGIKSDLSKITPEYKEVTIKKKKAQGKEHRWVTLEDKGDFKRGMGVSFMSESFKINSSDKKTDHLKTKYSEKIFGLNSPSLEELKKEIKPLLIRKNKKALRR